MLTTPAEGLLDDGGRLLGPDERRGMRVPRLDVPPDVPDEGPDGVERAAADRLARQHTEPGFDHVQPRGPGGSEVKVHARMRRQPRLDGRRRMRGRIVENDVQLPASIRARQALE